MRKADYQALAHVIARTRGGALQGAQATNDDAHQAACLTRAQAAEDIARDFARVASIEKTSFLHACGID